MSEAAFEMRMCRWLDILLLLVVSLALSNAQCPFQALEQVVLPYPLPLGSPNDQPSTALWRDPGYKKPSKCSPETYRAIARALRRDVQSGAVGQAQLLRIGFHTCSIGFVAAFSHGCMGGWLRHSVDADFPGNGGLNGPNGTIQYLLAIRTAYPCISFADLTTFSGALGAELAGGPPVAWYPGRPDSLGPGPSAPPFSAGLPNGMLNAHGVYQAYTKMGFTIREMVVLNGGGHSLGGAATDESGWYGSFTPFDCTWPTPANKYFVDLMYADWVPVLAPGTEQLQWILAPNQSNPNIGTTDPSGQPVFRLPSDFALKESSVLSAWATMYANNETMFTHDFQRVNQRLLQLGAGMSYSLRPDWFHWKGFNDDWIGFGTDIAPQTD